MLSHFQKTDALRDAEIRASIESLRSSIKPRRTVTRRGQRVRGVFPSLKSTTRVTFESRLEYVVLSLLEASAGVYRIESHPYVLELTRADGSTFTFTALCRIDTVNELDYFLNGGILQYVLRKLAA